MSSDNGDVGIVGLGLLGKAVADRLLSHGIPVRGSDLDPQRCRLLATSGGHSTAGPREVFERCDTVLLSLPTSEIVGQVIRDASDSLRSGQAILDTTTGDPGQMVAAGELLRQRGIEYVEANVAGSSEQVRAGQAVLFVGGEETVLRRLGWVLSAIAPRHFHLGPVGSASRFKLVHNLVLGLHRAVLAEGLQFAESLGFDPRQVLEILQQTPAASQVMVTKGPKMVAGEFEPQARLSQHLKDVRLILHEAQQSGAATPLSNVHRMLLEHAERIGCGQLDNSAIIEAYRNPPHGEALNF